MNQKHYRPASEAVLPSLTEAQLANWLRKRGARVVKHRGRYWKSTLRGYYRPVHWMARMTAEEAVRPTSLCWGFRTTLLNSDADSANGELPVHLMSDIENYDLQTLSSKRRNQIRNCQKSVEFVDLLQPDLLQEQGYEVAVSAHRRNGYGTLPSPEKYRKSIEYYFNPRPGIVLAGLVDGRLGGYVISYVVEKTAYIESLYLDTQSLSTNIGTGLIFELIQVFRRSGYIREVIHSPHLPENSGLTKHKEGMGFPVVKIPSRVWFAPFWEEVIISGYVRKFRPHAYYRLYGTY